MWNYLDCNNYNPVKQQRPDSIRMSAERQRVALCLIYFWSSGKGWLEPLAKKTVIKRWTWLLTSQQTLIVRTQWQGGHPTLPQLLPQAQGMQVWKHQAALRPWGKFLDNWLNWLCGSSAFVEGDKNTRYQERTSCHYWMYYCLVL